MPATLDVVDDGRGYLITGTGVLTAPDILTIKSGVESDPADHSHLAYWLVDLSGVAEIRLTGQDVRSIVDIDRRLARRMPAAVVAVVAPGDAAFGLSRMWEILAEGIGWPTGVFRDRTEAETFLLARTAPAGAPSSHSFSVI
ncbi:MAG TPA: hypothetical protein VM597_23785 [Gemmataceae bacterium]|jgi:precorrin isomerase|nr:hypothetical protein [Gemmataceae bacterium]